ncbi:MAG: hypothetical protein NTX25_15510 [Proteobacteria bacterium]|nr:hypothetical protein [Pseudomonadota bacterium]
MNKHLQHFGLASLLLATCVSCKSTQSGSRVANANSEGDRLDLPDMPSAPEPADWEKIQTTPLTVDKFNLVTFPNSELAKHMIPGSDAQKIPPNLQGIWWMDGNPLAKGDVVSFAKANWDFPNHRFLFEEYGVNNMSVEGNEKGLSSFATTLSNNLSLTFQFNSDYTYAQLMQSNRVPGTKLRIKIPTSLINYKLKQEPDGDYVRQTWVELLRIPDYHMRRIIDANGQPVEPNYSNWKKVAPAYLTVPISMKTP